MLSFLLQQTSERQWMTVKLGSSLHDKRNEKTRHMWDSSTHKDNKGCESQPPTDDYLLYNEGVRDVDRDVCVMYIFGNLSK